MSAEMKSFSLVCLCLQLVVISRGISVPSSSTYQFELDSSGYYTRNGTRFFAVGVNYWPGSAGVDMWNQWPEQEIQHDLDVIKNIGFNTLRVFLRWDIFEPSPGVLNKTSVAQLEDLLTWISSRGLVAHVSCFVGFMSSGYFWPSWKGSANLFASQMMQNRSVEYAYSMAQVAGRHPGAILCLEYGNELDVTTEAANAPEEAVEQWARMVTDAYKRGFKDSGNALPVLVITGTDRAVCHDKFNLGRVDVDLTSVHGYPVKDWQPIKDWTDMTDPLAFHLLPFYTAVTRSYGPVMVQEFSTIYTSSPPADQDTYLRGMLPLAWHEGSNGFMWWCLRDISWRGYPYNNNPIEWHLGLIQASNDTVRPGLEAYVDFARNLSRGSIAVPTPPAQGSAVRIFWPTMYASEGNDAADSARRGAILYYLLHVADMPTRIARGSDLSPFDPSYAEPLIVPCYNLTAQDIPKLISFAKAGGHVILSGLAPLQWKVPGFAEFVGLQPGVINKDMNITVELDAHAFSFHAYPDDTRYDYTPSGARVIAADQRGQGCVFVNSVGPGKVIAVVPSVEDTITSGNLLGRERDSFSTWYTALIKRVVE